MLIVSVQKCHNAPICGLFAKPANLIFKFLSLKISLIQADCHWKQVLVVRSTRFHGLEQSLEILPERDSDLLASLDKGIVHCRSQCTLNTTKEQRALALYGLGTYRSFCCQVIYGIFTINFSSSYLASEDTSSLRFFSGKDASVPSKSSLPSLAPTSSAERTRLLALCSTVKTRAEESYFILQVLTLLGILLALSFQLTVFLVGISQQSFCIFQLSLCISKLLPGFL